MSKWQAVRGTCEIRSIITLENYICEVHDNNLTEIIKTGLS